MSRLEIKEMRELGYFTISLFDPRAASSDRTRCIQPLRNYANLSLQKVQTKVAKSHCDLDRVVSVD